MEHPHPCLSNPASAEKVDVSVSIERCPELGTAQELRRASSACMCSPIQKRHSKRTDRRTWVCCSRGICGNMSGVSRDAGTPERIREVTEDELLLSRPLQSPPVKLLLRHQFGSFFNPLASRVGRKRRKGKESQDGEEEDRRRGGLYVPTGDGCEPKLCLFKGTKSARASEEKKKKMSRGLDRQIRGRRIVIERGVAAIYRHREKDPD